MNYQPPSFNHNPQIIPQKPHSTSHLKPTSSSNFPSRIRIQSQQETPKRSENLPNIHLNLEKIKLNSSHQK